jgi:hypothetical protein
MNPEVAAELMPAAVLNAIECQGQALISMQ